MCSFLPVRSQSKLVAVEILRREIMQRLLKDKYGILFSLVSVVLWFALCMTMGSSYVHADSVTISNSVSASSNTGHNRASNGEVVEGSGSASVSIITTRNGEVVEHIEESEEVEQGSVQIHVEQSVTDSDTHSSVSITTDGQESETVQHTSEYEVETHTNTQESHETVRIRSDDETNAEHGATSSTTSEPLISSDGETTTSTTVAHESSSIVAHVVDLIESLVTYVTTLFSNQARTDRAQALCDNTYRMSFNLFIS